VVRRQVSRQAGNAETTRWRRPYTPRQRCVCGGVLGRAKASAESGGAWLPAPRRVKAVREQCAVAQVEVMVFATVPA